jgi:hypothetical protein
LDLFHDEPPGSHGYGVAIICLFLRLVFCGVSLRAVPRVLQVFVEALGLPLRVPHWTTGRLWLMRLGHASLIEPLPKTDDWAWLIDHSVQIGQEKCLAILGIRLPDLPKPGDCLTHQDMKVIALLPGKSWSSEDVKQALEQASQRTGAPRVIVDDHGGDVRSGVALFQQRHRRTVEIYDIKHKAACLLKHRLEGEPRWQEFQRQIGQTRCAVQQTEMAFLVPPSPKPKARFMNLQPLLAWAEEVLALLLYIPEQLRKWVGPERLQEKCGWVSGLREAIAEWSEWQAVVNISVEFVNRQGIFRGVAKQLRQALPRQFKYPSSQKLAQELVEFVRRQARRVKPGERLPGSTEVLESCFGKMKVLEKQQSRGGFTGLVVAFGAIVCQITTTVVKTAMLQSSTRMVWKWCKDHLGTTLFGKRQIAFAKSATKTG